MYRADVSGVDMQQVPREPRIGAPSSQYEIIEGTAARALRPRIDVDDFFGAQPTSTSQLPDPEPLLQNLTRCVIEILAGARDRHALPLDTDVTFLAEELVRYVIGLLHTPTLGGASRDPAMAADRAKRTFALWASLAATGERPAMRPSG